MPLRALAEAALVGDHQALLTRPSRRYKVQPDQVVLEQVRNLQERLEEEHQALMAREADVAALQGRLNRLTQLVINAVRSRSLVGEESLERRHLLQAYWRPPAILDQSEVCP